MRFYLYNAYDVNYNSMISWSV